MLREDHVAGRGATPNPAREDRRDHSADPARAEATAAIRRLLDPLDAALVRRGSIRLPGGCVAWVQPMERQTCARQASPESLAGAASSLNVRRA